MAGKLFTLEAEDESCRGFKNLEVYRSRTMNVSGMKICEGKCKKPFRPMFAGQVICTQCAIAPHKKRFDPISEKIQEDSNFGVVGIADADIAKGKCGLITIGISKEKKMPEKRICVEPDCQKEFIGTGSRCIDCQKKWKAEYNAKYNAKNRTTYKAKREYIKLKRVNNEGEKIKQYAPEFPSTIIRKCTEQTTVENPNVFAGAKLFEACMKMCELSGSVIVRTAGMEITFKKIPS